MKRSEGCWRKKWLPFWSMTGRETEGLWKKNIGDLKVVGIVGRSSLEASIFQYEFKFTGIVTGVCRDVQAWPGREKEDLIEKRAYFGIKTAERIIEFECESKRDKQFWLDGIQYMLNCRAKAA
ncbi:hypothetical protein HN51_046057 [Arachis hypogaea]